MDTRLLRKNLLILLGYSVVYRLLLLWEIPMVGVFEKAILMACAVFVQAVILLSSAIDERSGTRALAGLLVALVGYGACTLGVPA
jgi:hypothetical protein